MRIYAYSESFFEFTFKTSSQYPESQNVNIFFQNPSVILNNYQLIFNILTVGSKSGDVCTSRQNT